MHEALLAVVMKPLELKMEAIHWTLDDVKQLLNNQALEIEPLKKTHAEKRPSKEMVDTMGCQLVAVTLKLDDLTREVDCQLDKKPK
jgi:hypothetical protein